MQGFGKLFDQDDEKLSSIPTPEEFTRVVETLVWRYDMSYFEAIQELCDYHDREYESVKSLLTPKLKLALMQETAKRNLLKDNKTFLQQQLG